MAPYRLTAPRSNRGHERRHRPVRRCHRTVPAGILLYKHADQDGLNFRMASVHPNLQKSSSFHRLTPPNRVLCAFFGRFSAVYFSVS